MGDKGKKGKTGKGKSTEKDGEEGDAGDEGQSDDTSDDGEGPISQKSKGKSRKGADQQAIAAVLLAQNGGIDGLRKAVAAGKKAEIVKDAVELLSRNKEIARAAGVTE